MQKEILRHLLKINYSLLKQSLSSSLKTDSLIFFSVIRSACIRKPFPEFLMLLSRTSEEEQQEDCRVSSRDQFTNLLTILLSDLFLQKPTIPASSIATNALSSICSSTVQLIWEDFTEGCIKEVLACLCKYLPQLKSAWHRQSYFTWL